MTCSSGEAQQGFNFGLNASLNGRTPIKVTVKRSRPLGTTTKPLFTGGVLSGVSQGMATEQSVPVTSLEIPKSEPFVFTPGVPGVTLSQPAREARMSSTVVAEEKVAMPAERESNIIEESNEDTENRQQVLCALFETQLKCLQVQNALQKLLLLRLKIFPSGSSPTDAEKPGTEKSALLGQAVQSNGSEESTTACATTYIVPEDVMQPLNALFRCSEIQIGLQKNIFSLLTSGDSMDIGFPSGAAGEHFFCLTLLSHASINVHK